MLLRKNTNSFLLAVLLRITRLLYKADTPSSLGYSAEYIWMEYCYIFWISELSGVAVECSPSPCSWSCKWKPFVWNAQNHVKQETWPYNTVLVLHTPLSCQSENGRRRLMTAMEITVGWDYPCYVCFVVVHVLAAVCFVSLYISQGIFFRLFFHFISYQQHYSALLHRLCCCSLSK